MIYHRSNDNYVQALPGIQRKTLVWGSNSLMSEFVFEGGSSLPLHTHPHEQTGYLISGRIRLVIDGTPHEFGPGDSWCIAGGMPHSADIMEDTKVIEVFIPVREDYLP